MNNEEMDKVEEFTKKDEATIVVNKRVLTQIGGILGGILMIFGCLTPMCSISLLGMTKSFLYISGDGKEVCVLAASIILLILIKKQVVSMIPTIASIAIFVYDCSNLYGKADQLVDYGAGFYLLILGFIFLVISGILAIGGKWDRKDKKSTVAVVIIFILTIVAIISVELLSEFIAKDTAYKTAVSSMQEKDYDKAIDVANLTV